MTSSAERPSNYKSNPELYLEDYPNAISDVERAHELALMTDYFETRAANLRLGMKAIMLNGIRKDEREHRYIVVFDNLDEDGDFTDGMREALMEDSAYSSSEYPEGLEGLNDTGGEVNSVESALGAIKDANKISDNLYSEGRFLLDELAATKR